jgi:hypothetical protein
MRLGVDVEPDRATYTLRGGRGSTLSLGHNDAAEHPLVDEPDVADCVSV